MENKSKLPQTNPPLAACKTIMQISKACKPAILSHIPAIDYGRTGSLTDVGQSAMERYEQARPAIEVMESIQDTVRLGELSEVVQNVMGVQERIGGFLDSYESLPQSDYGAEFIVREFDSAIGANLPEQMAMRGFQSSWPAIDAFNHQLSRFEEQGISYAQILENLRTTDFVQRNHDLLIAPAVQIYETGSRIPDVGSQILSTLTPIESIISNINGSHLFHQLSPVLGTVFSAPPSELFWCAYQRKCLRALMDAKWCPSLLSSLQEHEMIPLNKVLSKNMPYDKRVEAIDRFVFRRFGRDFIAGILEDWATISVPSYVRQLMCESVKAYRRKEYGLVVHSLPVQWEGIIKEKAFLPERVNGATLKKAVEKLVSENSRPKILSTFYEEFIMYQCSSLKDYIPDVPGRNAIAHGWFPEYPSRKAALNAIFFTDFLLHLDKLEESAAS